MTKRIRAMIIALVLGLTLSLGAGCIPSINPQPNVNPDLDIVEEAWDIIFQNYVDRDKLDATALRQAAIRGIVEALDDPYTSYLNAQTHQMSLSGLRGEFDGIGAHVGIRDGQLMIISPIAGSPADKAGIKAGDIIMKINGTPAPEMSLEEAVLRIRGPKGTPVRLLILHQGETEPVEIEIIRAQIELTSVNFEMREDIAYINISHFTERTSEELSPVMKSVTREGSTGIVLDLRHNPGGLLEAVVNVASYFLKEGVVVYVVDSQGEKTASSVNPHTPATDLPMVVLTDNFSASGSEVLTGALQDYGRAIIAGSQTYGKGSVNTIHELTDGSALYVTIARWLTPNQRLIEGEGIDPDYKLDVEGEAALQWAIDYLKGNQG